MRAERKVHLRVHLTIQGIHVSVIKRGVHKYTLHSRADYNLIPKSNHHEHDFPSGIRAVPSKIMQTAPMPWGGIVFIMNTAPDENIYFFRRRRHQYP